VPLFRKVRASAEAFEFLEKRCAMRTNSLFRYLGLVTLTLASIGVTSQAFALEDRAWSVESHAGTVWVHQASLQPVALNPNQNLRAGSTIETGEDGRVVIIRGEESIIISPRTSIALPEHRDTGMATTILQSFGTILLQVEKRAKQHFEVETPFLAAVVKGTKFTVTVDPSGAAVHVVEGAVEVIDLDTGDVGMVRPGQTAHTPAAQGVGLSVGGPGAVTPSRAAAPARVNKPVPAPAQEQAAASPAATTAPILLASVGSVSLDVGTTTNGLARAATVSNGQVSEPSSSADTSASVTGTTTASNATTQETNIATAGASGNVPAGLVGNTNAVAAGVIETGGNAPGGSGSSGGLAASLSSATPPGLASNPSSNAGGNGNGVAVGLTDATPPGLVNNPNSNAGGNGNGLAIGQTGATPPGLVNNPNSNAGGNGNGNGNTNSNAGGNGKGNGKA
jgi:hypothetical protein